MPMPPQDQGPPPGIAILLQAMMSDPKMLEELTKAIAKANEVPIIREWWQEPPKPTEAEMLAFAKEDQNKLLTINRRFDDNLARIRMDAIGKFDDYDEDFDVLMRSPDIAFEDQQIVAIVGSIPLTFESPRMKPADEDEAQAKEDFLYHMHDEHRRQHALSSYGDLDMEMVGTITRYGRLCTRNICRYGEKRKGLAPFKMKMIDPAIIYPTFQGENGMVRCTLIYQSRFADVLGDHDKDGKIKKKLTVRTKPSSKDAYELNDMVEVTEYWDCKWMAIFIDDILVKGPVAHNYGEPPFVYTTSSFGDPNYTRTPESTSYVDLQGFTVSSADADFARRGLSFYHNKFDIHAQKEAMMGKMARMVRDMGEEPIYLEQDDLSYGISTPDIKRVKRAVNILKTGEKFVMPPGPPFPPVLPELLRMIGEELTKGGLSPDQYGLTPSAQQSGFAIAGLSEQGKKKLAPIVRTLELHHQMVGEQRLRMYMENGDKLGDEGKLGEYSFPKNNPSIVQEQDSLWTVTPQMIYRTGTRVKCRLADIPDTSTLGALANALGILGDQGVVSRYDKIKLSALPGARNPRQTMRDIDIEQLREMPEFKLAQLLKYVHEELGDPEMAQFIVAQIAKGQSSPGGGGPQGPPPQGSGPPPGVQGQGQSLPGMGMPPGTNGGRPIGGPPPGPPPMGMGAGGIPHGLEP